MPKEPIEIIFQREVYKWFWMFGNITYILKDTLKNKANKNINNYSSMNNECKILY